MVGDLSSFENTVITASRALFMKRSIVATLLAGVFTLQLLAAGTGMMCVMPSGASNGASQVAGDHGMAGMDMSMAAADADASAPTHRGGRSDGAPCNQSRSSATCQVMAPCATGFVGARLAGFDTPAAARPALPSLNVLVPVSRATAPELPPPRA